MRRADIRQLKRAVSRLHDADAMSALLQRSVRFGHKRLALLRCIQAEQMGISVASEVLSYCQQVADTMSQEDLQVLLRQASLSAAEKISPTDVVLN